ncbi:hypothetical protein [Pseudovibrio sp. WM33]|uniref:hypothetical protein n=1 Tax=Pseudovibrio sp. WM33 TaxID=1735585 RepID=UPI0007AE7DCF|nr:hypothetical protein [Pseudovibrio sp. WM33]KZL17491.1 hypothetical protein PsWM33_05230 [Pseudovibrio sp. WM33]
MPMVLPAIGAFIAGAAAAAGIGSAPLSLIALGAGGAYAAGAATVGTIATAISTIGGAIGVGAVISAGASIASVLLSAPQTPVQSLPTSQRQIVRESVGYRRKGWGRAVGGGQLLFAAVKSGSSRWPSGNNYCMVIAFCDGRVSFWQSFLVDGLEVSSTDGEVNNEEYDGYLRLHVREGGLNQTAFTHMQEEFPEVYSEEWQGAGVALIAAELRCTNEVYAKFPNGWRTELSAIADLSPVFDQRDQEQTLDDPETWKFSSNAALVIQDHLKAPLVENGFAIPVDLLDLDDFASAADLSGLQVAGPEDTVRDQWSLSGWARFDETPAAILQRLLTACDGRLRLTGNGRIGLSVGGWQEPTVVLTDDDLLSLEVTQGRFVSGAGTVIKSRYVSPSHGYIEQDAIEFEHPNADTLGREITTADFLMASNHGQCRHLQKTTAARLNAEYEIQCVADIGGLAVVGERFIRLQSALEDVDAIFEVGNDLQYLIDDKENFVGVSFSARSITKEDVEYDEEVDGVAPPEVLPALENGINPDPPTLTVSGSDQKKTFTLSDSNASLLHQIALADVTDGGEEVFYIWLEPGDMSAQRTLIGGHSYEVRAKSLTISGISSSYSPVQSFEVF